MNELNDILSKIKQVMDQKQHNHEEHEENCFNDVRGKRFVIVAVDPNRGGKDAFGLLVLTSGMSPDMAIANMERAKYSLLEKEGKKPKDEQQGE